MGERDRVVSEATVDLGRITAIVALVSALCLGVACRQELEGLGIKLELVQKKLPNGLTVILVEDHTVPIVTYQTWVRVGSVDEYPGITGMAHLFEHLLFKGTPKYGPKQFFHQLETRGAEVNAFTARDYTVFYETFTPDLLEKVIDMESDRLANLVLTQEVLDTERVVVLEERRLRTENSPGGKVQEALWELAYQRHPYQWPVIGYPRDLLTIKLEDIQRFFAAYYQPASLVIVVVGDIDISRTLELVRAHYGRLPGREPVRRDLEKEPEQREERRLTLYDHVASERFSQAYHVTSASDDDSYALDVLSNILFEGTTSRVHLRLVEELQVALGVGGSNYTPVFPGLFIVNLSMKAGARATAGEAELDKVIREVQDKGVSEEEVRVAVRQLTVDLVDSVRTAYGVGQLIGTVMMTFGDPRRFTEDLKKYLDVKASDVKRVANRYLVPNNRSVVLLLPDEKRPSRTARVGGPEDRRK